MKRVSVARLFDILLLDNMLNNMFSSDIVSVARLFDILLLVKPDNEYQEYVEFQ
ncbi:hypothetical protein FN3523_1116 [Francisella hispaniensis]|uniref:Uncharacterized protein n=1 Tax=Francisella hispaniensis TaxID=622488 RepID=F4BG25_9GAMM|nr:hypothetical protein FN3523_1116 [Francisella hispaniensis]